MLAQAKFAPMLVRQVAAAAFSTFNPADKSASITLSGGNLTATNGAFSAQNVRGTLSKASGKWYLEWTIVSSNNAGAGVLRLKVGVATSGHSLTAQLGFDDSVSVGFCVDNSGGVGEIIADTNATHISGLTGAVNGDKVGMAVDVPNHLIWFHVNGTYVNSGNPATGTNGVDYITTSAVFPCFQGRSNPDQVTINVGASAFTYSVPSGFTAWG